MSLSKASQNIRAHSREEGRLCICISLLSHRFSSSFGSLFLFFSLIQTWCLVSFPANNRHSQVTTAFPSMSYPGGKRFARGLLFPQVPGHKVQISCDEASELDLNHPLSSSFKEETGSGMCPVGLQASRGNIFPHSSVHQLCEELSVRSKFPPAMSEV